MKKTLLGCFCRWHDVFGILLSRKPMLMLLILSLNAFQVQADTVKRNESISLNFENASLKDVFREIERKTSYRFFYSTKAIDEDRKVSLTMNNVPIETVVTALLSNSDHLTFKIRGDQIMLKRSKKIVEDLSPELSYLVARPDLAITNNTTVSIPSFRCCLYPGRDLRTGNQYRSHIGCAKLRSTRGRSIAPRKQRARSGCGQSTFYSS